MEFNYKFITHIRGDLRVRVSIFSFVLLLLFGAFVVGMWAHHKGWEPSELLIMARNSYRSYADTGMVVPINSYAQRTPHRGQSEGPYVVKRPEAMAEGYVLINRIVLPDHRYESILIDREGTVLHRWPIDYSRIHADGSPSQFAHVVTPLPDGSVLASFDDDARALVRLDGCGEPIWARTDQVYHHAIRKDDGKGYWAWQAAVFDGGHDHRMVRFDEETGDILESIDLMEDVMAKNPANQLALTIPEGFKLRKDITRENVKKDLLHPNDLKPLPAAYAAAYPQFEAGDLLVSFRNINMLGVIGRKNHNIIWAGYGPWYGQHDPDWNADGTITVYSNNHHRRRTSIVEIDPETRAARDRFWDTELDFNSYQMGQHQKLPNGNWLITSPMQGRVIEVTDDGLIVREWANYLDETYNATVTYAEWVPLDYFERMPSCSGGKAS